MELSAVLAFSGVAAVLIAVPGPDWAYILAAGMRERLVVPAVTGLVIGYALLTTLVAAGVGPLIASAPAALVVLTTVGAAYLIYLGIGMVRSSPTRPSQPPATTASDAAADRGGGRAVRRGIGVSALNPKGLLFFVTFLPQFARPASPWPLSLQLAVLGAVWALIVAVFYTVLGYTADRTLAARPGLARLLTRVAGAAMIVVAVVLLGEQIARTLAPGQ